MIFLLNILVALTRINVLLTPPPILDDLVAICIEYHAKVLQLEGDKWDLERGVKIRILEVYSGEEPHFIT